MGVEGPQRWGSLFSPLSQVSEAQILKQFKPERCFPYGFPGVLGETLVYTSENMNPVYMARVRGQGCNHVAHP